MSKWPTTRLRCLVMWRSGAPTSSATAWAAASPWSWRSGHPGLVRKLVLASTSFTSDVMHAVALEMFPSITPEMFAGSPIEEAYRRTAPNPGDFSKLVEKLKQLDIPA